MNLNKAFVLGNLTRDPERRALPSGQAVCNFSIATNRFYTSSDGAKQQDVEFHNIVAFGRLAETASQYLRKGSLVLIEGRLRTRNWQDAAGIKHFKTEIVGERLQLGPRSARPEGFEPTPTPAPTPAAASQIQETIRKEDIPVIDETGQIQPASPTGESTPTPPVQEPSPAPETQQQEPSSLPENNPIENTPPEQDTGEIDVKNIPF